MTCEKYASKSLIKSHLDGYLSICGFSLETHVYIACLVTLLIQINEFVREAVTLALS